MNPHCTRLRSHPPESARSVVTLPVPPGRPRDTGGEPDGGPRVSNLPDWAKVRVMAVAPFRMIPHFAHSQLARVLVGGRLAPARRARWDLLALGAGAFAGLLAAASSARAPVASVFTQRAPVPASQRTLVTTSPSRAEASERAAFPGKRPTPMSPRAAAHHLARAWAEVTGSQATVETLSVLWAHWAHETGRGRRMVDYNFAGLKGRAPSGASSVWWTTERTGTETKRVRCRFRAYATAEEGARDYVRMLHARFDDAFAAAAAGDARGFVRGLGEDGFFTAAHWDYERSLRSLAFEFREGPLAREVTQGDGAHEPLRRRPEPSK